jgi:dTDP-4-amino-4,6-dideoxygalactose transaminase
MRAILDIAKRHNLFVVEDACQAHGAMYEGRRAGCIGDIAAFSFYPGKNLGAYGDGGAVTTNDESIAEKVKLYRDFGQKKKYEHVIKGDNCRLDALQAAVLNVKLRHLDAWNAQRRAAASRYDALLTPIGIEPPKSASIERHVYHLYVVQVPDRDSVQKQLSAHGIQTGIHYPIPIHLQPAYAELNKPEGSYPKTEAAAKRILSLPMFPEIAGGQIDRVVRALESAVGAAV